MIHCCLIRLIIFLLANVHQSFVSCNDEVLEVRLNILLTKNDGWRNNMTNVRGNFQITPENSVVFSITDLFQTLTLSGSVEGKYNMVISLLGCEYLGVLLKYLILINNYFNICKNTLKIEGFDLKKYVTNHINMLNQVIATSPMFDQMYSAFNYIKEINPAIEEYADEWNDHISGFIDFTQILIGMNDNEIQSVTSNQEIILDFTSTSINLLKQVIENKCILLDYNDKIMYPSEILLERLQYILSEMVQLQKVVIENYYESLGFIYIPDSKVTFVPHIVTERPFNTFNTKELLAAHMYTILNGFNGWYEITNVRGKLELHIDNNIVFSSQDLFNLLYQNESLLGEENSEEVYLKTATLLSCKYMDVLLKFLSMLWQNLIYCQKMGNEKSFDTKTIYENFLKCFRFALGQVKISLPTFDYLYSALRYVEELYLVHEEYFKEFSAQVVRLSDFGQFHVEKCLLTDYHNTTGNVDVNAIIKEMTAISSFLIDTIVIIKGLADIRCELLDDNIQGYKHLQNTFPNISPQSSSIATLGYIGNQMDQLRNEVIEHFFHNLGFVYETTLKKAVVPVILSPPIINSEPLDTKENII